MARQGGARDPAQRAAVWERDEVVRVETHQRRIRKAVAALNKALADAIEDDVYLDYRPNTTENSDCILLSIRIGGWEIDEPKPPKAKPQDDPPGAE